jgi:hypothetical protein
MTIRERIAATQMVVRTPEVLTATRTISIDELEQFQVFVFGPNAASRNVDLPAAALCEATYLVIANLSTTGGATLVVRDAAATTILTIPVTAAGQRKAAFLFSDGIGWYGMLGA